MESCVYLNVFSRIMGLSECHLAWRDNRRIIRFQLEIFLTHMLWKDFETRFLFGFTLRWGNRKIAIHAKNGKKVTSELIDFYFFEPDSLISSAFFRLAEAYVQTFASDWDVRTPIKPVDPSSPLVTISYRFKNSFTMAVSRVAMPWVPPYFVHCCQSVFASMNAK